MGWALAAASTPATGDLGGVWESLIQAGVTGLLLYIVVSKVIPKILENHQKQEDQMRQDLKEANARHEAHQVKKDDAFLSALEKMESRAEKREEAMAELAKESTHAGQNQSIALVQLKDTLDGLRADVSMNTEVVRSLNSLTERKLDTKRVKTEDVAAAILAVKAEGGT